MLTTPTKETTKATVGEGWGGGPLWSAFSPDEIYDATKEAK